MKGSSNRTRSRNQKQSQDEKSPSAINEFRITLKSHFKTLLEVFFEKEIQNL
jgi:hypothetical protein